MKTGKPRKKSHAFVDPAPVPDPGVMPSLSPPRDLAGLLQSQKKIPGIMTAKNTAITAIEARDAEHLAVLAAIAALPPAEQPAELAAFIVRSFGAADVGAPPPDGGPPC